jgi:hypothetical protein
MSVLPSTMKDAPITLVNSNCTGPLLFIKTVRLGAVPVMRRYSRRKYPKHNGLIWQDCPFQKNLLRKRFHWCSTEFSKKIGGIPKGGQTGRHNAVRRAGCTVAVKITVFDPAPRG